MADDVRSLLKSERDARKIKHPHAHYSSSGQLLCSVCRFPIKSSKLWDSHIRSEQHLVQVKQLRQDRATDTHPDTTVASRKRKAPVEEEQERKRVRSEHSPDQDLQQSFTVSQGDNGKDAGVEMSSTGMTHDSAQEDGEAKMDGGEVDQDEWAAFEREMAGLEDSDGAKPVAAAYDAAPSISVAPMSAAELAAQAREEQSAQRGGREAELEDEKEDAEQQMDEEMGRMAQLDEKMRIWRERREAMKQAKPGGEAAVREGTSSDVDGPEGEESSENEVDEWGGLGGFGT